LERKTSFEMSTELIVVAIVDTKFWRLDQKVLPSDKTQWERFEKILSL